MTKPPISSAADQKDVANSILHIFLVIAVPEIVAGAIVKHVSDPLHGHLLANGTAIIRLLAESAQTTVQLSSGPIRSRRRSLRACFAGVQLRRAEAVAAMSRPTSAALAG
jgi:hypothetical protein